MTCKNPATKTGILERVVARNDISSRQKSNKNFAEKLFKRFARVAVIKNQTKKLNFSV